MTLVTTGLQFSDSTQERYFREVFSSITPRPRSLYHLSGPTIHQVADLSLAEQSRCVCQCMWTYRCVFFPLPVLISFWIDSCHPVNISTVLSAPNYNLDSSVLHKKNKIVRSEEGHWTHHPTWQHLCDRKHHIRLHCSLHFTQLKEWLFVAILCTFVVIFHLLGHF